MRTVTFLSILNSVSQFVGLDKDNLPEDMFTLVRESVNQRLAQAYESEAWPQLVKIVAQTVSTSGSMNYIPVTAIADYGEFIQVYDSDPLTTTRAEGLTAQTSQLSGNEIVVVRTTGTVYLEYRVIRPSLTGDVWAAGTFLEDEQAYQSPDFYEANTTTTEQPPHAEWDVVSIPQFLGIHLIRAAMADYYRANDNEESAMIQEGKAEKALQIEADKVFRQQSQTRQLTFVR